MIGLSNIIIRILILKEELIILGLQRERVFLRLQTVIQDEEGQERYEIKGEGELLIRNKKTVLTFYEQFEEERSIRHLIAISPDRVNINRSGDVQTNQQFILHKKTESLIPLPHGNIHMEIKTNEIDYTPIAKNREGKLSIQYEAILNEQIKRNHKLTLTFYKEERK